MFQVGSFIYVVIVSITIVTKFKDMKGGLVEFWPSLLGGIRACSKKKFF